MGTGVKYIGIGSKKQQGKDTLAAYICNYLSAAGLRAGTAALATPLKQLAQQVFGLTHVQCNGADAEKNTPTDITMSDLGIEKLDEAGQETLTAREVLQHLGVKMRQSFPGIWSNAPFRHDWAGHGVDAVLIPDVRFPDELENVKRHGGLTIKMVRPSFVSEDAHASETALEGAEWDVIVHNDGSLDQLNRVAGHIAAALVSGTDPEPEYRCSNIDTEEEIRPKTKLLLPGDV